MKSLMLFSLSFVLSVVLFTACKKEDNKNPIDAITTSFLTQGTNIGHFTLFNFENNKVVPIQDSASVLWDFGIRFTTIIINNTTSGPGNAGVQVVTGVFDEIDEAPESGYKVDAGMADLAVKDDDWFVYNSATRTFAPKAGQVFIFRTATNKYAKMEVLKADPTDDNGNEVTPPTRPTKIKYTIRYVFQPNGSRSFNK